MTSSSADRRIATLVCCVLASGALTSCSSSSGAGYLTLPGAGDPGVATVTLLMDGDPRPRSVGNIIAENPGGSDVAIESVTLRDAENVQISETYLIPVPTGDSEGLGVGFPMPPQAGDPLYDVHAARWAEREAVDQGGVAPGAAVAVVPLVELVDPLACGRFTGIDIAQEAGPSVAWNTTYVVVPEGLGEDDCT